MNGSVLVDRAGDTWSFTLNRPNKRNSLSEGLVDALLDGVDQAHQQRAKLLVFRAEGSNFTALAEMR